MADRSKDGGRGTSAPHRTVLSAREARQGEIVLGKYGRLIWIASFVAIVILAAIFGLQR